MGSQSLHATQTPATNISTTTGTFTKCLGSANINVQSSLNTIDGCFASAPSGTVTSVGTSAPITGGTITSTGTIGITQSTTSTSGYLSSTDWNTFNGKQSALTFANSLQNTAGTVNLIGDSTSPGNTMYYGTNGGGAKGFYSVPSTPPGGSSGNIQANNGSSGFAGITGTSYDSNGNIGVGSATPGQKLDVGGTVRATSFLGDGSQLTGITSAWTQSGNKLYPVAIGSNVGIGTSNPTAQLTIGSTGQTTINSSGVYSSSANISTSSNISATGSGTITGLMNYQNGNTMTDASSDFYMGRGGSTGDFIDSSGSRGNFGDILRSQGGGFNGVLWTTFPTINSASTFNRTAYYSSATVISGGSDFTNGTNIGIGTTLNKNMLEVAGGTAIGAAYAGISTAPSNGLIVSGNMGIGSISPGQKLDVQGTVRAVSFLGDGSQLTGISSPWTRTAPYVYQTAITDNVGVGSVTPGAQLDVQGTARFYGTGYFAGNVGIATTIPGTKLEVVGSGSVTFTGTGLQGVLVSGSGGQTDYSGIDFIGNSGGLNQHLPGTRIGSSFANAGSTMNFGTSNSYSSGITNTAMTINQNGNIGVSTTSPKQLLELEPPTNAISILSMLSTGNAGNEILFGINNSNTAAIEFSEVATGMLSFHTNGTNSAATKMVIDTNGNVGIGTTSTQDKLIVLNGNVGIGTWTPAYSLDIKTPASIGGFRVTNTNQTGDLIDAHSSASLDFEVHGDGGVTTNSCGSIGSTTECTSGQLYDKNGSSVRVALGVDGTTTQSADLVQLRNGNGAVLTHANFQGNIGIGTILSTNALDVNGGVGIGTAYAGYQSAPTNGLIVQGNVGIGTSLNGAKMNIGGACATQENVSMCIGKDANGIACIGYCTGVLGTCSACTCC